MNRYISKYLFYLPSTVLKGENVLGRIDTYRKFSTLSLEEIQAYQLRQLRRIVAYSLERSSFYSRIYKAVGLTSEMDIASFKDLKHLPFVTKADLIASAEEMSVMRFGVGEKTTGGSTGEPVKVRKNAGALARERAATWRAYEWAGVYPGDPQARFWGVPHGRSGRLKARLIDLVANRRRLSAFDVRDETLLKYYQQLHSFKAAYLYGYVSVIDVFADFLLQHELPPPRSLRSIITTSEVLTQGVKDKIQSVFNAKVFNEYGCGEVGSIAHECEEGSMHVMADNLYLEVDGGHSSGELVVTDFFNMAMPLIRYRLGDFATFSSARCPCGRALPVLEGVHGRAYDLIQTASGKKIHPEAVIYIFEDLQSRFKMFSQFQVVQSGLKEFQVKIVPAEGWNDESKSRLLIALKNNIGQEMEFNLSLCNEIDREKSGKMRLVKGFLESPPE